MKLGVFAKRKCGDPATPRQWADRALPAPTARFAFGSISAAERFGPQWRRHAAALGLTRTCDVTVLGDGAKWIWRQARMQLPGSTGVLDVFHICEHLHECGGRLFGETSKEAKRWAAARLRTLLKSGSQGVIAELEAEGERIGSPRKRKALTELANFLAPHADRTRYRERLETGRSIGSGLVEGACKTVVGKRLKQTGARWRAANARSMTALCCLAYGDGWDAHWSARSA